MEYNYYGASVTSVRAKNEIYPGITTLQELYEALCTAWSRETCTERLRHKWSPDNPTCGQCAITAFIVQDIFGGEIYEIPLSSGGVHCYNLIDGEAVDLASEQFGEEAKLLVYDNRLLQDRDERLSLESKRARYELLKERLHAVCEK